MADLEDSPNYVTVMEDHEPNHNTEFMPKTIDNESKSIANVGSPKTNFLPDDVCEVKRLSNPLFSSEDTNSKSSVEKSSTDYVLNNESRTSKIQVQLETSEIEPFLGYSKSTITKAAAEIITEVKNDSLILPSVKLSKGKQKSKDCSSVGKHLSSHVSNDENNLSIQFSMPIQPFLGFSEVDVDNNISSDSQSNDSQGNYQCLKDENNASYIEENTNWNKKDLDKNLEQDTESEESLSISLPDDSKIGHSPIDSHSFERESLYNTCNSEQSFKEDIDEVIKDSVIILERMNTSLFHKYYAKMPEYASNLNDKKDNSTSSKDFVSFQDSEEESDCLQSETNVFEEVGDVDIKGDIEQSVYDLSETTCNSEVNEAIQEELEECRSFVTTRRRNERTNNSSIFVLNGSLDSNSSAEFDKTVLSNNKIYLENNDSGINVNNKKTECVEGKECIEVKDTMLDNTLNQIDNEKYKKTEANVTARSVVEISGDINMHENMDRFNDRASEIKPNIVLQPGKKWERSLSIYRRLTMNDPVNHSLLDEEDLHSKGRKYRQSVIHTMDMQDKGYLLFLV